MQPTHHTFHTLNPGMSEAFISLEQSIQLQFIAAPTKHDLFQYLLESQSPVLWIVILHVCSFKIWMLTNAVSDIHKFNPLFFRCCTPALKITLVKSADDFIEQIFFAFNTMTAARIGVLRV